MGIHTRIAILALAAVSVLGGCQKATDKKDGTVKPAATSSTTTTGKATTTTGAGQGSSTTATTARAATTTTTARPATTSTTARPVTTTTAATVSYANCSAVKAAGKAPLHRGDPGYSSSLDRDGDGIACE